jgi:hypothetical protein
MTDARYTVYIDKAYRNYVNKCNEDKWMKEVVLNLPSPNKSYGLFSHEEFINNCQTNDDFANRWGCKIVIKELSIQERIKLGNFEFGEAVTDEKCDKQNIPTKLITVTYKDKTITSYE